jgi:predicted permease
VEQGETRNALLALGAGVGLLLCLGCANVSSLLLARGTLRQRELALCAALGAGRGRLLRQLLLEALLLSLAGGAAGVLLARALLPAALAQAAQQVPGLDAAAIDVSTLAVALVLAVASAALFGGLPAWLAAGRLEGPLRETRQGPSAPRLRALRLLTGVEVALAALLLCGALLLARTFERLVRLDPGFDSDGVVAMEISLLPGDYPSSAAVGSYYQRLLEELAALPGVESVASTPYEQPLAGSEWSIEVGVVGRPLPERSSDLMEARYGQISPDYFHVLGIPVVRGRAFAPTDDGRAPFVAVLNETAARKLFAGEDPVGQRVWLWSPTDTEVEVVGVVGDIRVDTLREEAQPTLFVPLLQGSHGLPSEQSVLVRIAGELGAVAPVLRERARDIDSGQPVGEPASLEQLTAGSLGLDRLSATLSTCFAMVALLLAALGLHGVVSYAVAGRRREVGVRLALGATPRRAAVAIVGSDLAAVAAGLVAGLAGALLSGRWLASRLFGVDPHDPAILATVTVVLSLVAVAGALAPFRRAARVDPAESLRSE